MSEYRVRGRYDLWRGVWRVIQSNVPGLAVEAATREAFVAEVERRCDDHAAGREHQVGIVTTSKAIWTIAPRFGRRVLVNGRLITRERMDEVKARYQTAG